MDRDQLSQRIIQISKQMDIFVSSENIDGDLLEVTFATFEWSASMLQKIQSIYLYLFEYIDLQFLFHLFHLGHLYELRRLCLNLSNACATIPSIPVSWVQSLTGSHKTYSTLFKRSY